MPQILNETDRRYLTIPADIQLREQFELRMLEENPIDGLLRLSICDNNGELELRYDISGMCSLAELSETQKLLATDIRRLILTLKHIIAGMAPYLLDPSGILLSLESVYLSPVSRSPCFLFIPARGSSFSSELSEFLKTVLACTDQDDYSSVVLAYRLYKESLDHPSALDRLEQILVSQENISDPTVLTHTDEAAVELPLPEALIPEDNEALIAEIREVTFPSESDNSGENEKSGGLFHRLFHKNEDRSELISGDHSEECAFAELVARS